MHRHVVAVMSRDRNGRHSRTSRLHFIEDREIAHAFRPTRWFSSTATLFLLDRKHCGIALPVRRIELHFARRSARFRLDQRFVMHRDHTDLRNTLTEQVWAVFSSLWVELVRATTLI